MTKRIRVLPEVAAEMLGREGWYLVGAVGDMVELARDLRGPTGLEPPTPLTTRAPRARQRAG